MTLPLGVYSYDRNFCHIIMQSLCITMNAVVGYEAANGVIGHSKCQYHSGMPSKDLVLSQDDLVCYHRINLCRSVHPSYTLFSKRSAHENHPNFLRSLGHRPRSWVILILSSGLESNSQVRVSDPWSLGELGEINVHFFCRRV